jgi:hypothetical protein
VLGAKSGSDELTEWGVDPLVVLTGKIGTFGKRVECHDLSRLEVNNLGFVEGCANKLDRGATARRGWARVSRETIPDTITCR